MNLEEFGRYLWGIPVVADVPGRMTFDDFDDFDDEYQNGCQRYMYDRKVY